MAYRRIRLGQLGNSKVVEFAVQELVLYLKRIDPKLVIEIMQLPEVKKHYNQIIWVGLDQTFSTNVPEVQDDEEDDAIAISIQDRNGYITGRNERSVLLAVYRFLKEMGCDWVRPGKEGERINPHNIDDINIHICEKPSYRHRGVCLEGADTYENVVDMIDFLPKVGMNEYFIQFFVPGTFFERWCRHKENPYLEPESISREEIADLTTRIEHEIAKRGICYHKVGHSWTCEAFGVDGTSWDADRNYLISDDMKSCLAQLDGKRELFHNIPLDTQLCYSNPYARTKMANAVQCVSGGGRSCVLQRSPGVVLSVDI